MPKRRRLRGKKLLVVSMTIAGASVMGAHGCATVANLVPPPPLDGGPDATADAAPDATPDATIDDGAVDAVVANLVAPPPMDAGPDAE